MWPWAREKSGACLQCVWQRSIQSTKTLIVFQCDPWILLGGLTHHKPTPQNNHVSYPQLTTPPSCDPEIFIDPQFINGFTWTWSTTLLAVTFFGRSPYWSQILFIDPLGPDKFFVDPHFRPIPPPIINENSLNGYVRRFNLCFEDQLALGKSVYSYYHCADKGICLYLLYSRII